MYATVQQRNDAAGWWFQFSSCLPHSLMHYRLHTGTGERIIFFYAVYAKHTQKKLVAEHRDKNIVIAAYRKRRECSNNSS